MNEKELMERLDMMADLVGFDEFEKIAVADLVRRIGHPASPEREQLFIQLGALINDKMMDWVNRA